MYHLSKPSGFLGHHKQSDKLIMPLVVLLAICLFGREVEAQYGGGTGEPNDPYLIYTAEQMNAIGANWKDRDKHFKLMADIDLSTYAGTDFNIIGTSMGNAFSGVFDGNSKKISMYTSTNRDYTGLFGYVRGENAVIKDLGLIDPNIGAGAGSCVGSLVGWVDKGTITNCYAEGGSVSGKRWVGGLVGALKGGATITNCYSTGSVSGNKQVGSLVGENHGGTITNCYATGSITGNDRVGGLAGDNGGTITNCSARGNVLGSGDVGGLVGDNGGTITNSSATGSVSGTRWSVGGLVGDNRGTITNCSARGNVSGDTSVAGLVGDNGGTITNSYSSGDVWGEGGVGGLVGDNRETITNCYATGSITGNDRVGGLVGINSWPGTITNCYSVGSVTGTTDVGGLVGINDDATVSTSFWDIQTSGRSNMCGRQIWGIGCNNVNGKTTAEMQTESTFLDADWDFVAESVNGTEDIWSICEGLDYPKLGWQFIIGDFDGDSRVGFADFAIFAARWLQSDSSFFWCRGTDLTNDGKVDFDDLKEFAENWLTKGIWRLTEADYITVDDFESYNDLDPSDPESNRIFNTWIDGYDNPATNGSVVGYDVPPFCEQTIVQSGRQSMPYSYDTFFKFSKAERALSPPQDWTEEGIGVLSLWLRGDASNAAAPMNVVLNGSAVVYHDDASAAQIETWTEWTIDLQKFAAQGVNLANVNTISIGFGDKNNLVAGGSGLVFFDDIHLYRLATEPEPAQ